MFPQLELLTPADGLAARARDAAAELAGNRELFPEDRRVVAIINDDSYPATGTYFDESVDMKQPMGRPSAITVLGHSDDTIFDTAPLSRPSTLQQWWFDN